MSKSLYLINPRGETPSYFGAEVYDHWGFTPVQGIADLAIPTVAALAPEDFDVQLCDEYISPIDFATGADYVGITGKITQASRMIAVADEFRRRGKVVIIGGPFASLSPEVVRDHCDVLVRGELEGIVEELFADLRRAEWKEEYVGDRPDLATSPLPRWDLYPNDQSLSGCVQTSRGCPFECEFCDVIQYLGRNQRHKTVAQILDELDALYRIGHRSIFLADDNFTAYRKRAKELLAAIAEWNGRQPDGPVSFGTQVSIDAARDDEVLELCAQAGMTWVFIGIETPNEESLRESHKRQNVGVDLGARVQRFLDHGVSVTGGMIVGFDADGLDIFARQFEFAMSTPIPIFSLGALVAPAATPLYDRMKRDGRLRTGGSEVAATPWDTNIVPVRMSREQLLAGLKWLCNQLYQPANFGRRVLQLIDHLGPQRGPHRRPPGQAADRNPRPIAKESFNLLRHLIHLGPEEKKMWARIYRATQRKPETEPFVLEALARYAQIRCMYDVGGFWEPQLAGSATTFTAGPPGGGAAAERAVSLDGG